VLMPTTFERSLLRQGRRGTVVTIPASWMAIHYLTVGDKVEIEVDDALIIYPHRGRKRKAANFVRVIGRKTGRYSYRVSVPPSWMRQHNLRPGDKVRVQVGEELTISAIPKSNG